MYKFYITGFYSSVVLDPPMQVFGGIESHRANPRGFSNIDSSKFRGKCPLFKLFFSYKITQSYTPPSLQIFESDSVRILWNLIFLIFDNLVIILSKNQHFDQKVLYYLQTFNPWVCHYC